MRSLPSVIKGYSVFVTITTDSSNGKRLHEWPQYVNSHKTYRSWEGFGDIPKNVQKLTRNLSLDWQFHETDLKTGSNISGNLMVDSLVTTQLRRVSPQTLDLRIPLRVSIDQLSLRYFGLKLQRNSTEEKRPVNLELTVRFQLCTNSKSEPSVSVRALSATASDPLTLPLLGGEKDGLGLDVSTLLSHLTVTYLNHFVFKPSTEDASPDHELLIALGGASEEPWHRVLPIVLGFTDHENINGCSLTVHELTIEVLEEVDWSAKLSASLKIDAATLPDFSVRNVDLTIDATKALGSSNKDYVTGVITIKSDKLNLRHESHEVELSKGKVGFSVDRDIKFHMKVKDNTDVKHILDPIFGGSNVK